MHFGIKTGRGLSLPMRRPAFIVFLLACISITSAFAQEPAESGGGQEAAPSAARITPYDKAPSSNQADFSKEAFVVEKQSSRFRFEDDGTRREEKTIRIRVQSEAGVQAWGQLRFGYNSANERLEIPYVRVVKKDGSIVTAGQDAIQDLSAAIQQVAPVYTDYREKHVTVPGLRPGDVLECETINVLHTPLAPGQFWMQHDFNQVMIVLDEQLEIDIPGGRTVKLKTKPGMEPKITEEKGRRVYRWTSSHLVREEDKEKEKDKAKKRRKKADDYPAVQLTTFGSWEEVGKWYAGLEKGRRQPSKEVRTQAEALTKGMTTDLDKVQALYDYVATNFRYVSLSLGQARYQPHAAAEVLHNQYGDCKDKHTLLAALLESGGMHASAVLMNAYRKLDPDVPSPAQFNHVITMLPLGKEEIWMDTTTEVAPFRLLSFQLRKKQGLVIPQGGVPHLEETPADPPMPDVVRTEIEGKVSESGRLDGKVTYVARGDAELMFRAIWRRVPAAQLKTFTDAFNKKLGLGGDVSDVQTSEPSATHEPFTFSYTVSKANFVDWSKKKVDLKLPLSLINPVAVSADVDEEPDEGDAASAEPFKIGAANENTYKIKLELAVRYKARVPVPVSIERDYGTYQSTYKLEGNVFTAERKLVTRVSELAPARADDYRAFRRSVMADSAQSLSIESAAADTRNAPADLKSGELISSGNEARKQGNLTLAISLLNRAVESEPKSKSAWNDLGLAYYESKQDALAINAFQKQFEVDPFHQFAYNNLGRVYLREQKYEEAVKWFRKQLEVNPLDKYAHGNLGQTFVEWQKYEEAIPELDQAASITPNNADPEVRLGEAYLNLGQDDKAMAAFGKAVQISATPLIWNNIAYQLSLKKAHLDLARRYAESAVASTSASLRNISLDQLSPRDLRLVSSAANYWDTLGWVEFCDGNLDKALKYVLAAWQIGQGSEGADHLGQIYAKQGDKGKAEYYYALALNAPRAGPGTRRKLSDLLGSEGKADAAVEKYKSELQQVRTIKVNGISHQGASAADFFVLLSAGRIGTADGVKFVSGDEALKTATDALRNAKYEQSFPDDTPVKLVRRGTLHCKADATECTFLLELPDDVRSVE